MACGTRMVMVRYRGIWVIGGLGVWSLPEEFLHDDLRILDAPDKGVDQPAASVVEEEDASPFGLLDSTGRTFIPPGMSASASMPLK